MRAVVRALGASEVAGLLDASRRTRHPERDRAIVALAFDTGLRRGELARLRRVDLGPDGVVRAGGPRGRALRLGTTCLEAMEPFLDRVRGPLLPATERIIHEQLLQVGSYAGLGHWVTARHARRTWLTLMAGSGLDIPTLLRLGGHAPGHIEPASIDDALAVQFMPGWRSALDTLLSEAESRRRAA